MSNWSGKYVIGLTGNIATGKSVVRRMLEHLGAYTIDADALSHRAIAKGAPGFQPVLETFGKWILDENGEINRGKLGNLVFRDPAALTRLEGIVHPLVRQAVDVLVKRASQPVIVIEAIKLLEGELRQACDAIWVSYAPQEVQIERLTRKRRLSREDALQRVNLQSPQGDKVAAADTVIRNIGSYDDLWKQVTQAWQSTVPAGNAGRPSPTEEKRVKTDEFSISRGKPRDCQAIAELINSLGQNQKMTAGDVMAEFGEKAYMLLQSGSGLVGLAGWQVENLVVRTTDLYIKPEIDTRKALGILLKAVEQASSDLQCEASLVFPAGNLVGQDEIWKALGYESRAPETLGIQAWTDAALESMPVGAGLYFKQLRRDRVLRPI